MKFRTGIGQDSHQFLTDVQAKPCIIGGILFENVPGMEADSDGDVVFHAICNAITSLTHVPILGKIAPFLCLEKKITNSRIYLEKAIETLKQQQVEHVALTLEGKRPKFQDRAEEMRTSIAKVLKIKKTQVGITFTSGDGLTSFGQGKGLMCYCILTTFEK